MSTESLWDAYDENYLTIEKISNAVDRVSNLLTIGAIIAFIRWFRRAYWNLHHLGVTGLRYTEGWAAGAWFVPIMNYWAPYQIMRDLWIKTQEAIKPKSQIEGNEMIIGWWTAYFIVPTVLSLFIVIVTFTYLNPFDPYAESDISDDAFMYTTLATVFQSVLTTLAAGILVTFILKRFAIWEPQLAEIAMTNWKKGYNETPDGASIRVTTPENSEP